MAQINFKIDEQLNTFIELKMKLENKSKAAITKEIFLAGINKELLPYLAQLYKMGKISIKKIALITNLSPIEVMDKIANEIEDIEVSPEDISYSEKVANKMLSTVINLNSQGFTLKDSINDSN